jgi:hypothetical protein
MHKPGIYISRKMSEIQICLLVTAVCCYSLTKNKLCCFNFGYGQNKVVWNMIRVMHIHRFGIQDFMDYSDTIQIWNMTRVMHMYRFGIQDYMDYSDTIQILVILIKYI